MDRNAGPSDLAEESSANLNVTGQNSPLLKTNDGIDETETHAEFCWCCSVGQCICGGCLAPATSQPFQTRTLECLANFLFWCSGMYTPGGNFSRYRWNLLNDLNKSRAGVNRTLKVRSYDTKIASSYLNDYQIRLRVFEPLVQDGNATFPVMVFIHGGGFCIGDAAMTNFHVLCEKFAAACQVVVVSVSYRLAPEHPFPAAVEDCYDVALCLATKSHVISDRINIKHGIILSGDSAGGNLACVVAALARDRLDAALRPSSVVIPVRYQALIYPALFMQRTDEMSVTKGGSAFLPVPVIRWFSSSYTPGVNTMSAIAELAKNERRLCPVLRGFENLPPTTIVSAGLDHLRFENEIAVRNLRLAGVECVHHHVENVPHGFMTFHFLKEANETFELVAKDIVRELAKPSGTKEQFDVGSQVELISFRGLKGRLIRVRTNESIAEIDLGWAKAFAPLDNTRLVV